MSSAAAAYFSGHPEVRFRSVRSRLRATNQYTGLYALDTFDVTNAFSITAAAASMSPISSLQDQLGIAPALNGNDSLYRASIRSSAAPTRSRRDLTAYAGYSEANRAPTPLELGCANPAMPCIIALFLVSDPPLKQVVSHTVEAGLRGTNELSIGTLGWKLGVFRADQHRRHSRHSRVRVLQGFGYFQNVGSTAPPGHRGRSQSQVSRPAILYASYSLIDARFLNALTLGSATARSPTPTATSRCSPGDHDPGGPAPSHQGRLRLFGHRRVQGRRRCAVRQQSILRR